MDKTALELAREAKLAREARIAQIRIARKNQRAEAARKAWETRRAKTGG